MSAPYILTQEKDGTTTFGIILATDLDLQDMYDGDSVPQIVVTAADGPVTIRDAATPTGANLLDIQDNAAATLFAVGVPQITQGVDMLPSGDETLEIGSLAYRLKSVYGKAGTFVGGAGGGIARVGSSQYSVFAGRSAGDGSNTLEMGKITTTRPPVALFATSYAIGLYGTAEVSHGGGNAFMAGAAASYGGYPQYASTSILESSAGAFASFTGGYAFSYRYCSGTTKISQSGKGSFMWGYLRNLGAGKHYMTTAVNAAGSFIHGRTIGYGSAYIYSNNSARGSFTQGYIGGIATAIGKISTRNVGSFAQGAVQATTAAYTAEIYSAGKGSFAQGYVQTRGVIQSRNDGSFGQGAATGTFTPSVQANGRGSFAQGRAHNGGVILASGNGAFAQGTAVGDGSIISATAGAALARGFARGGYAITASAAGAHALGDTTSSGPSILATAQNAFQLCRGTNAVADSLQVGVGCLLKAVGDANFQGDLTFTTDGSGLPFGHMFTNATIAVTIGDANPTEIGDTWTTGELNLVTFGASHYLTVTNAGRYRIEWALSIAQNTPSAAIQCEQGIMINGTAQVEGRAHRTIANTSDIGASASVAILDLAASDQVSLYVANLTNTTNIDIEHGNLTVTMVGGT